MNKSRQIFELIVRLDESWESSAYGSVNRWIRVIRRRSDSRATKLAYFKWLSYFLRFVNLTLEEDNEFGDRRVPASRKEELIGKVLKGLNPDVLVGLSKADLAEKVQAFCDLYNDAGKARTAHLSLSYLRSFFKANEIDKLELEDYHWRKNRRPEYVPIKEEVYKIADQCDARGRALVLCAFESGLRNAALRALRYNDIKEDLEELRTPIVVSVTPELKKIVPEACKEDAQYFTFFGKEASDALREYMEWRRGKFGDLDDAEPLFAPYESFSFSANDKHHLSEDSPERLIKRAARRARIKEWKNVRFHSLRKSFRAVLDAGYMNGGQLAEDDKEFLMGHRLPSGKEPYHTANIQTLKERYMQLKWSREAKMTEEDKIEAVKTFAKTLGIQSIEIRIAKIRKEEPKISDYEALGRILREQLGIAKIDIDRKADPKKIIPEAQLQKYLDNGWDIQTVLPSGKILVKK